MSTVTCAILAALGGLVAGLVADHLARAYVEGRALLARAPRPDAAARRWRRASLLALAAVGLFAALSGKRGAGLLETIALCAPLAAIGRIDWQCRLIFPHLLAIGHAAALGLALAGSRAVPPWREQVWWSLGCGAAYGLLCALAAVLYRRRGREGAPPLGVGDVALAALVGALLGEDAPGALLAGQVLAGIAGAAIIARRRGRVRHTGEGYPAPPEAIPAGRTHGDTPATEVAETVPLGSYLCLAAVVWLCLL